MNAQRAAFRTRALEPRNLILFFAIAFGWSWFWWFLFIFGVLEFPAGAESPYVDFGLVSPLLLLFIMVTPFGPTIGAFVVSGLTEGKAGVGALWRRFWGVRFRVWWLLAVFVFPFALWGGIHLFFLIDTGLSPSPDLYFWIVSPITLVPLFLLNFVNGGLSEEFGWRGYVLPRLQSRFNALQSSLILGVVWASWHIPLWLGLEPARTFSFLLWAGVLVLGSVMFTWIFNNTNGSVLAVALFHMTGNVVGSMFPSAPEYLIMGETVAVLLILAIFGSREMVRRRSRADSSLEGT
jgi:membrane protease YdiL (CAAX protease family)